MQSFKDAFGGRTHTHSLLQESMAIDYTLDKNEADGSVTVLSFWTWLGSSGTSGFAMRMRFARDEKDGLARLISGSAPNDLIVNAWAPANTEDSVIAGIILRPDNNNTVCVQGVHYNRFKMARYGYRYEPNVYVKPFWTHSLESLPTSSKMLADALALL